MPAVSDFPQVGLPGHGLAPVGTAGLPTPCPYDGFDYRIPLLGPWPAGDTTEPYQERPQVARYDAAGFTVAWDPAPVYRCATCGQDTTRRVVVAIHVAPGAHPALQFSGEYRAECGPCSGSRPAATPEHKVR